MIKKLLVMGVFFIGVSLVHARNPLPTASYGVAVDGGNQVEYAVSVPTHTYVVALATDSVRTYWFAQVIKTNSSDDRVYFDDEVGVSTQPASSNPSMWVKEGDFFTYDDPIAWQGALYMQATSTGSCKVLIKAFKDLNP